MHPKDTTLFPKTRKRLQVRFDEILRRHFHELCTERDSPAVASVRKGFVRAAELWPGQPSSYFVVLYVAELLGIEVITTRSFPESLRGADARQYVDGLRARIRPNPEGRLRVVQELGRVAGLLELNPEDTSSLIMTGLLLWSEPCPQSAADLDTLATGWGSYPDDDRPTRRRFVFEDLNSSTDHKERFEFIESTNAALEPRRRTETRHGHETKKVRDQRRDIQEFGHQVARQNYLLEGNYPGQLGYTVAGITGVPAKA